MRKTIDAAPARGLLVALIAALLVNIGPAAAEAKLKPAGGRAEATTIALGAGYAQPHGSERVRALQQRLRQAGERPGPLDGLYGPLTAAAVRRFQQSEGLAVDGIVGPLTTAALRRPAALLAPGAGYGRPHGSERVRALQRRLRRAGERPGPLDGLYGPLTAAAVRRFQSSHGLVVDGIVGAATRGALARRTAAPAPQRRRTGSPRPGARSPRPKPASNPSPRPITKQAPAPGGNARPAPNPGGSGFEFPGLGVTLVLVGAIALALIGIALRPGLLDGRRPEEPGADREPSPAPPPSPPPAMVAEPEAAPSMVAEPDPEPSTVGVAEEDPAPRPRARADARRRPLETGAPRREGRVKAGMLGYAIVPAPVGEVNRAELIEQAEVITGECARRGLELLELVREREPRNGKGLERPGLGYAFARIAAGEARGLVVSELSRLSRSAAELGVVLEWFARSRARLVAVAQGLDTDEREGRLAARTLIEVSRWERERLSERTQQGLQAARLEGRRGSRRAVADDPELRERIARMRAQGMTLQAIADRLNESGVPTVRGGAKWRPSSVQAAAGYKRRPRTALDSLPGPNESPGKER
jgi:peptidoglycan hydrolase-like protein with peptidoglycan-binding domain/DNA invertase Pin-like site-specific DNA recombinase